MIPDMIDMVAKVKIEALTHELVDYLLGQIDNQPKEPQWTFKLYRAIGNVKQAVKIAVNIAQQEQELGNYKYAHDILLDTFKDIRMSNNKIPFDLNQRLMLIHSFTLAKRLVKMNDHVGGARMLIRVAQNISQFPQNMVNILTSTVAECTKANMKQAAFNWACILVRPEYRNQIPGAFQKKVESIARKAVKTEDETEPVSPYHNQFIQKGNFKKNISPCPFCKFEIPETRLECPSCKNNIPFCVASGKHMTLKEWSNCPNCKLPSFILDFITFIRLILYKTKLIPAIYSDFKRLLEADPTCPMCETNVTPISLQLCSDPDTEFKQLTNLMKESGPAEEEANGDDDDGDDMD